MILREVQAILFLLIGLLQIRSLNSVEVNCESDLRMGQYLCIPSYHVDPKTQQIIGCTKDNVAKSKFLTFRDVLFLINHFYCPQFGVLQ